MSGRRDQEQDAVRATAVPDASSIGAKAATLQRLAAAGLPVPPFVVLSDALRQDFLASLDGTPDADGIRAAPWPPACRDAVRRRLADLARSIDPRDPGAAPSIDPTGIGLLAVRSSMEGEDGPRLSYAGQLDSFLNVPADIDAADQLEFPNQNRVTVENGIHPQLAVLEALAGNVTFGRLIEPEEVARTIHFCALNAVINLSLIHI